jgi:hypothetical protein
MSSERPHLPFQGRRSRALRPWTPAMIFGLMANCSEVSYCQKFRKYTGQTGSCTKRSLPRPYHTCPARVLRSAAENRTARTHSALYVIWEATITFTNFWRGTDIQNDLVAKQKSCNRHWSDYQKWLAETASEGSVAQPSQQDTVLKVLSAAERTELDDWRRK